jgi:phage terminase large subunit GpA-like protein
VAAGRLGPDFRRFVIDYGVIPGHISEGMPGRLDALLKQTWPNAFGRKIGDRLAAIDGNAWTEDVWALGQAASASKLIMVRGRGEDSAPRSRG